MAVNSTLATSTGGSRADWLVFAALGAIWGSSYLFIKIGVETLTPFTLVAMRLAIGAALLAAVVAIAREPIPRNLRTYGHLLVMSIFNIAIPFSLITWAELSVTSSLASILTSTVPLFVIVFAAFALRDEPITLNRAGGLALGFVGVLVLTNPQGFALGGDGLAQLALLGAAASYAIGAVYARRNVTGLRPMVPAFFQVLLAFAISAALALVFERPFDVPLTPAAIGSVVWLGLLGSGVAYLMFFRLLRGWGATRTTLVAYVMPVVGIALGFAFAGEVIDGRIVLGTALVLGGIALVNARFGQRRLFAGPARTREAVEVS